MGGHFLIRIATEKDIESIVAMRLRLQKHMAESNSSAWQMSTKKIAGLPMLYRSALKDQHSRLVVAEEEESGAVLGMGLGRISKHEEHVPNESGTIDDIWVEPSYRHKGLCKKIVAELVAFFESNGIDTMVLSYVNGNLEAEAVWRRLGFHSVLTTATARRTEVGWKVNQART
jgi:ribosomal protein S18 acetylase RimI-like enzyme